MSEATTEGVLHKKLFLKISQNSQENTCARVPFLILIKNDSGTGIFLWISGNFQEHLYYATPPNDYFCNMQNVALNVFKFSNRDIIAIAHEAILVYFMKILSVCGKTFDTLNQCFFL